MKRVYFGNMENLAAFMIGEAKEKKNVYAVLFYAEAKELLRELIRYRDLDINSIEFEPEEWDNYNKEFYIAINGAHGFELFLNKAYSVSHKRYLIFDADCLILDGQVNSGIVSQNENERASVYEAVWEDDENVCCDECDLCAYDCKECENEEDQDVHFDIRVNGSRYTGSTTLAKLLDAFLT